MSLWTTKLPGLMACPVTWTERVVKHRLWACAATAEEPLVALVIGAAGRRVEWVKPSVRGNEIVFDLLVSPLRPEYDGVHFIFGTACQSRSFYCRSPANSGIPDASVPERSLTGEVVRLLSLHGDPIIAAGVLIIAKRDVNFGRCGRWNVRPALREQLRGGLRDALSRGRTGNFELGGR